MVAAAERSAGVALAPPSMFAHELSAGRLVQPFGATVDTGRYYLTRLAGRDPSQPAQAFARWCLRAASAAGDDGPDMSDGL